ncbi:MAG: hypothetical protein GY823_01075 [Flavobacteriaceae bacterium]|nr:hypothetical protein [Flavobacteriaceae bacterium]
MKLISIILGMITLNRIASQSGFDPQYTGGNNAQTMYNNPALISKLIEGATGRIQEACLQIPGIGYSVLSIRQFQQSVNNLLDSKNPDSFAKMIYFQEYVNPKTRQLIYKSVVMFKTFTSTTFIGIESLYKPDGFPSFEVLSYIMDSDIRTIRTVMKDESIDPTQLYACGDLKALYSAKVFQPSITVRVDKPDVSPLVDQLLELKLKNHSDFYYGHPGDYNDSPQTRGSQAENRRFRDTLKSGFDKKNYGVNN